MTHESNKEESNYSPNRNNRRSTLRKPTLTRIPRNPHNKAANREHSKAKRQYIEQIRDLREQELPV